MKNILLTFVLSVALISCTSTPDNPQKSEQLPKIFPDYIGVTIPTNIAPLDFNYAGGNFDCMDVTIKGVKGKQLHSNGEFARFNIDDWHEMVNSNKGDSLIVTVCIKKNDRWIQYRNFSIYISPYGLDEYGLTYRKIAPGYEVYSKMGIYQRDLSNYDETAIFENTAVPGACVNCHTSNRTDPKQFTFHVRGANGATIVQIDGKRDILTTKIDSTKGLGSCVYPYWHPSGKYCAYSTNKTKQAFHCVKNERIEVFDQASDLIVYEPATHSVHISPLLTTKEFFETFPAFSPDGKTLYFCSAKAQDIPTDYKKVRYNLCKIGFNPANCTFGSQVETVVDMASKGKSITFPRPSYDGKYLMFTLADYGTFPIWHREADLWLFNLKNGSVRPLTEVNSTNTESFHNWNTNSHWFVFSSRRGDGLYTRLYLASIDDQGKVSKPFLLPQENPWEYYDESLYSYNVPDFTKTKVVFDARSAANEILDKKRTAISVR